MRKWTWSRLPHHIKKEFFRLEVKLDNLQVPSGNEEQWMVRYDKCLRNSWRAMTARDQYHYLKTLRENWRSLAENTDYTIFRMIAKQGEAS